MALSSNKPYSVVGATRLLHVKIAVAGTYYKGGIMCINPSTGYAVKAADTANFGAITGVLTEGKIVGSDVVDAVLEIGSIWIDNASAVQTSVGSEAYATADDTIATSATNADPCGIIEDVEVGKAYLVRFGK